MAKKQAKIYTSIGTFSHSIEDHINKDVSPSPACAITIETKQEKNK